MNKPTPFRVGAWLASDQAVLEAWLARHIKLANECTGPLHPVIQEFKNVIERDAEIFMLFSQMFTQVPQWGKFSKNPAGEPQVRDYQQMLRLLNLIMTQAPEFNQTGLVGFPINAIFDWSMATPGGYAAFLNQKVNRHLKIVLNEWSRYLGSKDSCAVLSNDPKTGWFGKDAMAAMPNFDTEFQCDPSAPHHGYTSWDDFFTRQFRAGQRPIADPGDDDVICNACESAPYRLEHEVKAQAQFWIKSQPYSLGHMLGHDARTAQFVGGTVYQAFLSALSYHRWHSPVSGTIIKATVIDGTYYSEAWSEGFDPAGPNNSQGYITQVATRALIFIQADNPAIGLMCFMAVGMAEVSTCQVTVYEGQHVTKGDQLGMFHFGGSTHCLMFRPEVKLDFDLHGQTPGLDSSNIEINSKIARVRRA